MPEYVCARARASARVYAPGVGEKGAGQVAAEIDQEVEGEDPREHNDGCLSILSSRLRSFLLLSFIQFSIHLFMITVQVHP